MNSEKDILLAVTVVPLCSEVGGSITVETVSTVYVGDTLLYVVAILVVEREEWGWGKMCPILNDVE